MSVANFWKRNSKAIPISIALLFMTALGLLVTEHKLPWMILVVYLALSVVSFIMYLNDKAAAQRGTSRIPESTLHWVALLGGWPGALLGQQTLRHKSKKMTFRVVLWLTILLNVSAFIWLFNGNHFAWFGRLFS